MHLDFRNASSVLLAGLLALGCMGPVQDASGQKPASSATPDTATQWPTAGGDPGGQRYSPLSQITKGNVKDLGVAWTFHTRAIEWVTAPDGSRAPSAHTKLSAFESTPILFDGRLYLVTPGDEVIALDPGTGQQIWRYNPSIDSQAITSRGITPWMGPRPAETCGERVFLGTLDARLISLDARTGLPCAAFGNKGSVDLHADVDYRAGDYYAVNSPPAVVGNVVIVGSAIQDNTRVDMEKGVVRGYDAQDGHLVWSWEPIPWAAHQKPRTGSGNAWSYLSADLEHGLVYVPTGSSSPDFYGGMRPGDNRDADSVVALEAATGRRVWGFQTTHHNLWDYDVAAQPVLFTFRGATPAIAITTKMGMVFVLNRLTGEPIYPVTERPVPQTDVPGEMTSPTQPFSSLPSLSPLDWPANVPWSANAADDQACRKLVSGLRNEGIYTPPSFRGSLLYPGNLGGVNWGSPAFDPATGILYADTNRYAFSIRLIPRAPLWRRTLQRPKVKHGLAVVLPILLVLLLIYTVRRRSVAGGVAAAGVLLLIAVALWSRHSDAKNHNVHESKAESMLAAHFSKEGGEQLGTPYEMYREPLLAPDGKPCTPQPWGTVSAINLNTGEAVWQKPLGTLIAGQHTGTLNLGGPIATGGGLVFTAASSESEFRALSAATGDELWKVDLPVPAQSTPMTYQWQGRQYVVLSAGGHGWFGTPVGDSVIAYALKP